MRKQDIEDGVLWADIVSPWHSHLISEEEQQPVLQDVYFSLFSKHLMI